MPQVRPTRHGFSKHYRTDRSVETGGSSAITELIVVSRPSDLEAMWNKYEQDIAAYEREQKLRAQRRKTSRAMTSSNRSIPSVILAKLDDDKSADTKSTIPCSIQVTEDGSTQYYHEDFQLEIYDIWCSDNAVECVLGGI